MLGRNGTQTNAQTNDDIGHGVGVLLLSGWSRIFILFYLDLL